MRLLRRHLAEVDSPSLALRILMPPTSAARLLELIDSGQLQIVSGIRHIEASADGGFTVVADNGEHTANFMINAANDPARRLPPRAEPLIASVVAAGVADRHPRGGLHLDRATSQLVADDERPRTTWNGPPG